MRGIVEPRCLAIAITRARGPCSIRTLSGIGRGQGDGRESGIGRGPSTQSAQDDAYEPLFSGGGAGYGHGIPLNSKLAGGGRPGLGAAPAEEAADQNVTAQFGNASAGRGFAGSRLGPIGQMGGTGVPVAPLLPNISLGRSSPSQRASEDPFFSDRKPSMPTISLGFGGLGRGKPVQNAAPVEDFSSERRRVLPRWEEKINKIEQRDAEARAEEWKHLGEDRSMALGSLGSFRAPSVGASGPESAKGQHLSSRSMQAPSSTHGPGPQLRSPNQFQSGFQEQQVKVHKDDYSAQTFRPSTLPFGQSSAVSQGVPAGQGWQSAPLQSHRDATGQLSSSKYQQHGPPRLPVPGKEDPYHVASRQPSPPQNPTSDQMAPQYYAGKQVPPTFPASTMATQGSYDRTKGNSYYGARMQAPPRFPAPAMGVSHYESNKPTPPMPSGLGMGESQDNASRQAAPSTFAASVTGESLFSASRQAFPPPFPASGTEQSPHNTSRWPSHSTFSETGGAPNVPTMPYYEQDYHEETGQQAWANPEVSAPFPTDPQTGDWYYDPSVGAGHETSATFESGEYFSQQTQGPDLYSSGNWQPSWSASPTSEYTGNKAAPNASDYDYDWIGQPAASTEPHFDSTQEFSAEIPLYADESLDYDARIEECHTQGKLEAIDAIYAEMKAAQVKASAKTYDTLMQTYMKLGKADKMSQVYQEMREVIIPTAVTKKTQDVGANDEASGKAMSDREVTQPLTKEGSDQAAYATLEDRPRSGDEPQTWQNTVQEPPHGYGLGGGFSMSGEQFYESVPFVQPDASSQGVPLSGMHKPSADVGAGRGKKVDTFFDFAESGGLGRGKPLTDQQSTLEKTDDYSETFRPIIKPEWQYAFAPEGLPAGPGVGRGRPFSPQAHDSGIGRGWTPSPQAHDAGVGRGRTSYPQHLNAAVQPQVPIYAQDASIRTQLDRPQEQVHPRLPQEEAGDRAIKILDERLNRRIQRFEQWYDDEDDNVERRMPVRVSQARLPREKKQSRKTIEQQVEAQITEEEAKEEAERLKKMGKSEEIENLQHMMSQFMKSYGEMGLELEYHMGDFMTNPDIDEKPLPPLEEYLEKAKPNFMKTGIIRTEKQWQRMVKDVLKNASYFEEFVEKYSGPGRYTAKQENEDLEEIAKTLPSDVGPHLQAFVNRSLTTLKSNPGFNLDEKQWMLANMVDEFSQFHYDGSKLRHRV